MRTSWLMGLCAYGLVYAGLEWWLRETALTTVLARGLAVAAVPSLALAALGRRERRGGEATYRQLCDRSPIGIFRATLDGRLLYANRALVSLLGYASGRALQGVGVPALFVGAAGARHWSQLVEGSRAGEPRAIDAQWARRDGTVVEVRLLAHTRSATWGGEAELEGIVEDRTERSRVQEAQRLEAIGQLAGGIAHDFNNQLTAILGYTELLLGQLGSQSIASDLREIQDAARRAADLTQQLLAFSRRQVMRREAVDVNQVISRLQRFWSRIIRETIQIETRLSPEAPVALVDPAHLDQVLTNLVLNARDAMPAGGSVRIRTGTETVDASSHLGAQRPEAPGAFVVLTVTDTGCGMSAATKARAFEPFFTTKPVGQGTGLGLASVYGIVRQLGGTVWIDSAVGQGTTVTVYLPVAAGRAATKVLYGRRRRAWVGSELVLLVEDEDAVRHFVQRVLERHGYRVTASSTPAEALAIARAEPGVDLLVSDIVLPELDGRQLYATLAKDRPELPVVFMSGHAEGEVGSEEAPHVLRKPFGSRELLTRVRRALDVSRHHATSGDPDRRSA